MSFTCAPKSLIPPHWSPRAPAAAPACSRTATPPPACTRTHDCVGIHARSELLRVSRHERRTRPRSAGWSPPRGESRTATAVRMSIPPLSRLSGVTLTPPSTHKITNNSDPQHHTDTGYTCRRPAETFVQLALRTRTGSHGQGKVVQHISHIGCVVDTETLPYAHTGFYIMPHHRDEVEQPLSPGIWTVPQVPLTWKLWLRHMVETAMLSYHRQHRYFVIGV